MTYTIQTENEMPDFFEALKNFVDGWKGVKVEVGEEQYNEEYVNILLAEKADMDAQIAEGTATVYADMKEYRTAHGL